MLVQAHPSVMRFWRALFQYFIFLSHPFVISLFSNPQYVSNVNGQVLLKGQIFTNGLAIVDAPAPNSVIHAGSAINIAIDVSGDGQLSKTSATGFDSMAIFLVSADTGLNLTVSVDPALLTQDPGSTVKHLNWPTPACLTPGSYNLTFYEGFHLNGASFFGITPVPVSVENPNQPETCTTNNALDVQPQPFSAPSQNAWLNADVVFSVSDKPSPTNTPFSLSTPSASSGELNTITISVGSLGLQWPITIGPPLSPETVVIQPAFSPPPGMVTVVTVTPSSPTATDDSDGDQGTITVMVSPTAKPTPITIVLASATTSTGTTTMQGGLATTFTSLSTTFATTTGMMGMPESTPDSAGFLPINAVASATTLRHSTLLLLPMLLSMFHLV